MKEVQLAGPGAPTIGPTCSVPGLSQHAVPLRALLSPARSRRSRTLLADTKTHSVCSSYRLVHRGLSIPLATDLDMDMDSTSCSDIFLSPVHPTMRPRSHSESRMADVAYDCYLSKSCVYFLHHPTVFSLCRLRKKLGGSDRRWMEEFLENQGLELLFECLGQLSKQGGGFQVLVMRLECVLCIRTCVNSRIGLDYLITSGAYAGKFALGGCTGLMPE